jgi:isocitrate lyase
MSPLDQEEQLYLQDVEAVKKWWSDSRWRYTKRPFTAEQIVQKRGTIKIDYPSNVQAKKLWKLVEERFAVWLKHSLHVHVLVLTCPADQNGFGYLRLP